MEFCLFNALGNDKSLVRKKLLKKKKARKQKQTNLGNDDILNNRNFCLRKIFLRDIIYQYQW